MKRRIWSIAVDTRSKPLSRHDVADEVLNYVEEAILGRGPVSDCNSPDHGYREREVSKEMGNWNRYVSAR